MTIQPTTGGVQAPAPSDATKAEAGPKIISVETLRKIMTRLKAAKAQVMIEPLNRAMAEFEINKRLRVAAFLAQIAHESMEFLYMEEIASGRAYDITVNPRKAKQLGNIHPGDGPRYKGRGPIQLTGRNNYRAAGKALGLNLEDNPQVAAQPTVAFRVAGWFWKTHGLNALADVGNFKEITHRINGGQNGAADRKMYYDRALVVLKDMK
jgi:putative chitinase